jgi:solute:Na+ symporter, SSS family
VCFFVTVIVSYLTKPKPENELTGLVYGATAIPQETGPIYHRSIFWAVVVVIIFLILNALFW